MSIFGLWGLAHINAANRAAVSAAGSARRGESKAAKAEWDVRTLTDRLDKLSLICLAMWELIREKTDLTEEDLVEARTLGMRIIDALNSTDVGTEMAHWQYMRERAVAYLKQGVDSVRAAAAFVFQNDPYELERYPSLFAGRKYSNGNGEKEGSDKESAEKAVLEPADEKNTAIAAPMEIAPSPAASATVPAP